MNHPFRRLPHFDAEILIDAVAVILLGAIIIGISALCLCNTGCTSIPDRPPLAPGEGFRYEKPVRQI